MRQVPQSDMAMEALDKAEILVRNVRNDVKEWAIVQVEEIARLEAINAELLEACKRIVAQYGNVNLTLSEQMGGYEQMVSAITKAEGES